MEFRLLGTVEATVDGRALDLGPARQRCVLAALLVDINHVVLVDQLLDRVWGEHRPHRGHGTLYSYLSRLRTVLADVEIAHRSGGYVLSADPASVDLHRFRLLTARARASDGAVAAALFAQALELWRGEPFATLDTPWLHQMRTVLEAERRAAELDRNDLELRQGRHAERLAELTTRAAEHPLDERQAGQLMLALYRSGRQAEALRVYQSTRTALIEELGLEPGPELGLLQRRILSADPSLAVLTPPAAAGHAVVPRQLPVDVVHFTGRERYLADLREVLDSGPPAVVITAIDGTAGVGKTALAVHFGHRVADRFPDGQLYVDLRGYAHTSPMRPAEALGWMLRSLGVPPERIPAEEQEQAALYRSTLAGKRVLLVLDNARNAAQIRPLLPASPGCLVVITSRTTMATLDGVSHLHLDVLSEQEALSLLARVAGRDRVDRELPAATTLITLCAKLPLAVRIAAARLAARPSWTIAALVDRLTDEQRRLDELRMDDRAVRASFEVTYQALQTSPDPVDQRAARAFRMLGILDWADMSVAIAAALLDQPHPDTRDALERLVDAHLLDSTTPDRYHTHDLLRLYSRDTARHDETPTARHAALRRALDCYIAAAEQATRLLTSDSRHAGTDPGQSPRGGFSLATPVEVAAWTEAEHVNLLVAVHQALTTPETEVFAVRLATAATRPFEIRSSWGDLIALLELASHKARDIGDRSSEALSRQDLGFAYLRLGRITEAITVLADALTLWRQIGDRSGEATCLRFLGFAHNDLQQPEKALLCHQEALAICRDIGDRYGEAGALNALGLMYQQLQSLDEAIAHHRQALAINQERGNSYSEASALGNLGWAYFRAGQPDRAVDCHQQALTLAQTLGSRYQEAESLWGLGQAHHALGRHDEARTYWQRAITILQDIGALTAEEATTLRGQPIPDTPEIIRRNT